MMVISRNFENNVANDSILAASPSLLFSKNPEKAMENENILLILHEVSPENIVSPSSHRCQLSSTSHTNNDRNSLMFDVTGSNVLSFCSHGYIEPDGGRVEVTVMPINGPQLSTAPNLQILIVVCMENDRDYLVFWAVCGDYNIK
ncbi:hypothetical protein GQX74_011294 [Glossina fuscipes]|nr:hypothetical protein GQX74_011294 [Glossina fuscipes]